MSIGVRENNPEMLHQLRIFSSTTLRIQIFKQILSQSWTRTIVFNVIGVYLYHFQGGRSWEAFVEGKNGLKIFVKRLFTIFAG